MVLVGFYVESTKMEQLSNKDFSFYYDSKLQETCQVIFGANSNMGQSPLQMMQRMTPQSHGGSPSQWI